MTTKVEDFGDPFNWRFPQRKDTMSLQTITKKDAGFQIYDPDMRTNVLQTKDIKGASPELKPYKFINKETYVNRKDDISGTSPRKLNQFTNKESFNLKTDDIKGTKTQVFQFQTTRKSTNPLVPEYKLPYVEQRPITPPKFFRNTLNIDDIEGSKPNPKVFKPRKEDIYTEIEGSKTKEKFIPKQHIDSLNVADINQYKRFISTRNTNPLLPMYELPQENSKYNKFSSYYDSNSYGPIWGMTSKRLHPIDNKGTNNNLQISDIHGTMADTHSDQFLRRKERTQFRNINNTRDMPWANASSLKKGIQTIRSVNPLQPIYQNPGIVEAENDRLEELRQTNPELYGKTIESQQRATSQLARTDIVKSQQSRRGSELSQQSNPKRLSQTQASFRPPKPKFDTLGNKIQTPKVDTQPKPVENVLNSSKTVGNLSGAQKLDKFISK